MSKVNAMSLSELKEQAVVLGIAHAANIGEETLRNKILEALGEPVEAAAPVAKPAEPKSSTEAKDPNLKRVTIIIQESEQDGQPVVVGFNGKQFAMKRGQEVTVPQAVLNILDDARIVKYDSEMKARKVLRFPYQIVSK